MGAPLISRRCSCDLGYRPDERGGAFRHPERQAIFVGDLIDRGPEQLRVLATVKAMVDAGSAQIVMGNHEFNAVAYATEHPVGSGCYLRPHNEKNNRSAARSGDTEPACPDWAG